MLGIKKPVIISYGKSNARAIECALYQAMRAYETKICDRITEAFMALEGSSLDSNVG